MEENPKVTKSPPAKPVVKAKAKTPVKPKVSLIDNGDGTITDPNTGLMWKQTDAWLDMHRFYHWGNHREYVDHVNKEKFSGYDNWRIPSKAEALSLHDKEKECLDKNGSPFFVDPLFAPGGVGNTWISECTDEKITRYDWKTGIDTVYPIDDIWASIRLVRKEGEAPPLPVGGKEPEPVNEEDEAKPAQTKASAKPTPSLEAPLTEKPDSDQAKTGPTPKKGGYSADEKVELLKRAKAHAKAVQSRKG